ncbi:hypothetical protein [Frankia sp. AgKG'84/4]
MIEHSSPIRAHADWTADASRIDQVVYVWSRARSGREGYFPVASSLSSAGTRSWHDLLAGQAEPDDAGVEPPASSLAYLVGVAGPPGHHDPDEVPHAALVHRVRVPGRSGPGTGRRRAHVLLGRADYLTERVALALYSAGTGQADAPRTTPRLAPLRLAELTGQRRTGERSLRHGARAAARRHRLTNLIATVLAWSWTQRPFAVSHTGAQEAVTLMWALVETLETVLPYRLTFSSHITSASPGGVAEDGAGSAARVVAGDVSRPARTADGSIAPRLLFVPMPPDLALGLDPDSIHVDPRVRPYVPPIVHDAARLLVAVYGLGGMRAVSGLLAMVADQVFQPNDPERWCRSLVAAGSADAVAPGDTPDPEGTAGPSSASWPAVPVDLTILARARDSTRPPRPSGSEPPTPEPLDAPTAVEAGPRARAKSATGLAGAGTDAADARQAWSVDEHLRDAYEAMLRRPSVAEAAAGRAGPDPGLGLALLLATPAGLPVDLPAGTRFQGQLRRLAGMLLAAGTGTGAAGGAERRPPRPPSQPALAQAMRRGRAELVDRILVRAAELGADPGRATVESAVAERQRQVEGMITALADDLAALPGPSPTRGVQAALRDAEPTLTAGIEAILVACRLPTAADQAQRLAAQTLAALRPVTPTPLPAGRPHPAGNEPAHPSNPPIAAAPTTPVVPVVPVAPVAPVAPVTTLGPVTAVDTTAGPPAASAPTSSFAAAPASGGWTPDPAAVVAPSPPFRPSAPVTPAGPVTAGPAAQRLTRGSETPAATVVRLLRETHAWGADAFRLLVLYAPGWDGAQDLRHAIADAAALSPAPVTAGAGGAFLAAGARPVFERLMVGRPDGQPSERMTALRRVLDLYHHDRAGSGDADLDALAAELTARIPATDDSDHSPTVAFLAACESELPDAAQVFGLLARHVPSWEGERDLHEAIWRWGTAGRDSRDSRARHGSEPPTGAALAAAAERYFRRTVQSVDAEAGGPHPADLERVVRRLAMLYLPDDPQLRAAAALADVVESRILAEITDGPNRRRRRSFGLPVITFTLLIGVMLPPPARR